MLQVKLVSLERGNHAKIPLGNGNYTIIDRCMYDLVMRYKWYLRKCHYRFYAYSNVYVNGKRTLQALHRLIAQPKGLEVVHHLNKDTLDNRRCNLLNMLPLHHRQLHRIRHFRGKKQWNTTIQNSLATIIHVALNPHSFNSNAGTHIDYVARSGIIQWLKLNASNGIR